MTSGFQNSCGTLSHIPKKRPSELFRADLISAMKVPDSHQLEPNSYVEIKEPWRTEWEAGVQVCANELPRISFKHEVRSQGEASNSSGGNSTIKYGDRQDFRMPPTYMKGQDPPEEDMNTMYELDELDIAWLGSVNKTRKYRALAGSSELSEDVLQKTITLLERKCYQNMLQAIKTEESLRIEYDESVVCDICRDPEREENNEMIFCDSCNVCVHQACYGVLVIPDGSWVCKPCGSHTQTPPCALCPNRSGALKRVKPSPGWAHVSCALWIPEVKLGNVERMEPITNIEAIPGSRWNLLCSVCRKREGACIQCSYPTCHSAYHVTCGFKDGLEMRTRLTTNGVAHESYCAKHTTLRKTPTKSVSSSGNVTVTRLTKETESSQLKHLQDRFYEYTTAQELSKSTDLSLQLSSLIRNYWILRRKSLFNRPLIPELHIDFTSQRLPSGVKYEKTIPEDEDFLSIIHTRRNLEMARNLVYMVQRRERSKRQLVTMSEEITRLELKLIEEEADEEKKGNKQPLCLKRLGVVPTVDYIRPTKSLTENGDEVNNSSSGGSDSESSRVLRKKKNHQISTSNSSTDHDTVLSPKRSRRLSEGAGGGVCTAMDGVVTLHSSSTNRQLLKGNGTIHFNKHQH